MWAEVDAVPGEPDLQSLGAVDGLVGARHWGVGRVLLDLVAVLLDGRLQGNSQPFGERGPLWFLIGGSFGNAGQRPGIRERRRCRGCALGQEAVDRHVQSRIWRDKGQNAQESQKDDAEAQRKNRIDVRGGGTHCPVPCGEARRVESRDATLLCAACSRFRPAMVFGHRGLRILLAGFG